MRERERERERGGGREGNMFLIVIQHPGHSGQNRLAEQGPDWLPVSV